MNYMRLVQIKSFAYNGIIRNLFSGVTLKQEIGKGMIKNMWENSELWSSLQALIKVIKKAGKYYSYPSHV